jgi:hypothetical protein
VFLVRVFDLYTLFPWLDIPTHHLGGLVIAYSFCLVLSALQNQKWISRLDQMIELVLIFTLVSTVAVFWEFAEFLLDRFLGTNLQISLPDAMKDLLMGMLGALTMIVYKITASRISRTKKASSLC